MRGYCNEKPAEMCLVPMKMGITEERMGHCGLFKKVKLKYELCQKQKTGGSPKQGFTFQVQYTGEKQREHEDTLKQLSRG